jgi:hypothetical protein
MKNASQRDSAAVLVFAVLLLAAGVFVLAGIAQLAATQALVGQNEWEGLNRRIKLENSRAMGRQFMLTRMFNGVVSTNTGYTNATLGGFSLSPVSETSAGSDYWTTLSTTNTNVNLKINPFTLMERGGFYRVVVPGTIYDGVENVPWNFQVRTRSPIAAGYPLTQHRPASNAISGFLNPPYIDMNDPEQFVGFHEMARMRVSSVTNTNVLFGESRDTNGYIGYVDVPVGIAAFGFFTNAVAEPLGGGFTQLEMVLDLGSVDGNDLSQVLRYVVPATGSYTDTNTQTTYSSLPVRAVRLIGSDAIGRKPLQIIVPPTQTNLQTLYLSGRNTDANRVRRPVYFNFQRSGAAWGALEVVEKDATGRWCIGISATHSDITFRVTNIVIVGGVRTDGGIFGFPLVSRERDPGGLDYVADRMMWLEDYKTP